MFNQLKIKKEEIDIKYETEYIHMKCEPETSNNATALVSSDKFFSRQFSGEDIDRNDYKVPLLTKVVKQQFTL